MRIILVSILFFLLYFHNLKALPQFALITGNKCISCHTTSQGGGLRNELGAYSYADVALVNPESIGLQGVFESLESNTFFDGKLTIGLDGRLQTVRGHSSSEATRKYFPMQGSLYAMYSPFDEVKIEANYNAGHSSKNRYPGQQPWLGWVMFQPSLELPSVRIGRFSPSIGIRYDDHSKLTRQFFTLFGSSTSTNFFPPSLSEYGAEVTYDSWHNMTAAVGVFGSMALSEIRVQDTNGVGKSIISSENKPTVAARVQFIDQFFDSRFNAFIGSSVLFNDDYMNLRGFSGFGLTDEAALMLEYSQTEKKDIQKTSVFSVDAMYELMSALYATARYETGTTSIQNKTEYSSYAVVLGLQAFVLPHIELRPEYRIVDTDAYRSSRWAVQLHFFY